MVFVANLGAVFQTLSIVGTSNGSILWTDIVDVLPQSTGGGGGDGVTGGP